MKKTLILAALTLVAAVSCTERKSPFARNVEEYAVVNIAAPDLSGITDNGKEVLNLYRFAADEADAIYWKQYFGDKQALLDAIRLCRPFPRSGILSFRHHRRRIRLL